jgi:hypothetical protein
MFSDPPDGAVDRSAAPCGNFCGDSTSPWKAVWIVVPTPSTGVPGRGSPGGHDCGHAAPGVQAAVYWDVGRLALFVFRAGVDGAVELVVG